MPQHVHRTIGQELPARHDAETSSRLDWKHNFSLPGPIKQAFARFPLVTYPANPAPARAPRPSHTPTLYIFTTDDAASRGSPSFNPSCLKWQTFLKATGIDFNTAVSNNHAAPGGSLPFLLPASVATTSAFMSSTDAIPCNKLRKWAETHGTARHRRRPSRDIPSDNDKESNSDRDDRIESSTELYTPLIDDRLRKAWLCQLYLDGDNFAAVAKRLYIDSASTSSFVRSTTAYQLRRAARAEVVKTVPGPTVDVEGVIADAERAFEALASVLGDELWFFGARRAGLFDASVFAYTHLLLDEGIGWRDNRLGDALRRHDNLVGHRARLLDLF